MTKYKVIYIIASAFLLVPVLGYGQADNMSGIRINEKNAREVNNVLTLDFDIELVNYAISSRNQMVLTPVIDNGAGKRVELPEVVINGKQRDNLYKRQIQLDRHTDTPSTFQVVKADKKEFSATIPYTAETPYEAWMDGSRVYLLTDECGCGGTSLEESVAEEGSFTLPVQPVYSYTYSPSVHFVAPPKEEIKRRSEDGSAYIIFPVGSSVVYPDKYDNRSELGKIQKSLAYVKDEPTAQITAITIQAYASPEGSAASNLALSQRRADALRGYISGHNKISSGLIRSEGMGENWTGLLPLLEADETLANKEEVLRIIRSVDDLDGREKELKRLSGGNAFRYLLSTHFPRLRRSDYQIEYTVPGFTIERGKELLHTRPDMLSQEELYIIANTYDRGGSEFNEVFEIAHGLYPADPIANMNAAAAALEKNEVDRALQILEENKEHPGSWNNLGVALMAKHRFTEAREYLQKAMRDGSGEAAENLVILEELEREVNMYKEKQSIYKQYRM